MYGVGKPWRHKEFVVLFADGRHGDRGARAWLGEYHHPGPEHSKMNGIVT